LNDGKLDSIMGGLNKGHTYKNPKASRQCLKAADPACCTFIKSSSKHEMVPSRRRR
ncbi:hypothetical protein PAXINDRAFT_172519, partial [Paxillus involutus ATCC 200175]